MFPLHRPTVPHHFPIAHKKDEYKGKSTDEMAAIMMGKLGVKDNDMFVDVIGDPVIVNKRMLMTFLGIPKNYKGNREIFVEEFVNTIKEPDEVYLEWEKVTNPAIRGKYPKSGYRLVKKLVKYYKSEDKGEARAITAIFSYEKNKTQGITVYYRNNFEKVQAGKLIYSKK